MLSSENIQFAHLLKHNIFSVTYDLFCHTIEWLLQQHWVQHVVHTFSHSKTDLVFTEPTDVIRLNAAITISRYTNRRKFPHIALIK